MKLEFISKSLDYLNNDPIEIFEGNIKYKDLPFSDTIKNKIKAYLTKMVEDEEVLAELTAEA